MNITNDWEHKNEDERKIDGVNIWLMGIDFVWADSSPIDSIQDVMALIDQILPWSNGFGLKHSLIQLDGPKLSEAWIRPKL